MEKKHNAHSNGNNTANRGFASMPHEKVVEIASKGGKAAHATTAQKNHPGVNASSNKAGHKGMAEKGRVGGEASSNARRGHKEEKEK